MSLVVRTCSKNPEPGSSPEDVDYLRALYLKDEQHHTEVLRVSL